MIFVLTDATHRSVVVESPSFFDARKAAEALFSRKFPTAAGKHPISTAGVAEGVPEFELKWDGTDAGPTPNRQLFVRERQFGSGDWSAWGPLR